jgi:O-antigen/teichoic acid export membrane protein
LPLFGNTIGFWIINSGDKYLIKWFLGIEAVGVYAALYKFGNLIMLILTPIIEVLLPDMAYLYDAGELLEMKRRLVLALKYYGIISSFAIVGLVGSSRLLVAIADLREQSVLMSTGMLLLLSLSSTLMGLSRILLDALSVKGKTWTIGWVWVGSAVLNVLFSLILIPLLGIQGAAVSAFLIFVACLAGVTLIVKRSYVQFSIWEGWGGRVLISLILSVLVAWLMTINLPVIFPLGALVSIGIFVGLLFIMGLFGSKEISRTLEAIKEMGV